MKKTKMLAIVLAVAVMLLGAGYAWWQDAIKISGTVDTGKVDVQFLDKINKTKFINVDPDPYTSATAGIVPESKNKTLRITIEDLYPGAKVGFDFAIVNRSTMPVKLKAIDVTRVGGSQDLFETLTAWGQFKYKSTRESTVPYGNTDTKLKDLKAALENGLKNVTLTPNQCVYFNNFTYNKYTLDATTNAEVDEDIALFADIQGDVETLSFGGGGSGTKPVEHGLFIGLPDTVNNLMETQCSFDITFTYEQFNAK